MNVALALCRYLDTRSLVTFDEVGTGGDCFIDRLPSQPPEAVMVKDTGGYPPDGALGYDHPTLQILVRGTRDPRTGHATAQAIFDRLQSLHAVTLDSSGEAVRLIDCQFVQSAPAHLGTDENERHLYSLNPVLHVRNATSNRE